MQENPRINQQHRQKIMFSGFANPKISQQCTPTTYTHRSSALPEGPLGVFHRSLWPLKAPGSLGEDRQASRQLSDTSTHSCTGRAGW